MLLSIAAWLNIAGCSGRPAEVRPGLDTTQCDPATRADCVSVSEAFVLERLAMEEKVIRLQLDLKSCRRAADRR